MKLVAAIIYMCVSGVCNEQHVEIEKRACSIGVLHGKMGEADAKIGVRCLK